MWQEVQRVAGAGRGRVRAAVLRARAARAAGGAPRALPLPLPLVLPRRLSALPRHHRGTLLQLDPPYYLCTLVINRLDFSTL